MEEVVKKEITLDELAQQMADGFAKSNEQYDELTRMVADGFAAVTGRIDSIESRMATKDDIAALRQEMHDGFKAVDDRFAEQTIKIDFIRTELVAVKYELAELSKRVTEDNNVLSSEVVNLKARVAVLETKLNSLHPI